MIPVDLHLLTAKDLFINQSALTGKSMPVEKFAHGGGDSADPFQFAQDLLYGRQCRGTASHPEEGPAPLCLSAQRRDQHDQHGANPLNLFAIGEVTVWITGVSLLP